MTFTKLFSSITESTIWQEDDHTRLVWITMLAMCNRHGFVFGSEPGLASRAKVPLESTIRALEKFQQPDKYSRTKDHEGRRIEIVDGGWRLLNYEKHRAIRNEEERREYMKLLMRDVREKRKQEALANVSNVSRSKPPLAQAEADSDSEKPIPPKRKKKEPFPENFQPNEHHKQIAKEQGVNLREEWPKFRDHAKANARLCADWNAAGNNWIRQARKFDPRALPEKMDRSKIANPLLIELEQRERMRDEL